MKTGLTESPGLTESSGATGKHGAPGVVLVPGLPGVIVEPSPGYRVSIPGTGH